jgi:hypothetical protein
MLTDILWLLDEGADSHFQPLDDAGGYGPSQSFH